MTVLAPDLMGITVARCLLSSRSELAEITAFYDVSSSSAFVFDLAQSLQMPSKLLPVSAKRRAIQPASGQIDLLLHNDVDF